MAAWLAACAPSGGGAAGARRDVPPGAPRDEVFDPWATEASPPEEGIGTPCAPGGCGPAGTCLGPARGFPGGYCTRRCGEGERCPRGASCLAARGVGAVCAADCRRDEDCRAGEGYRCGVGFEGATPRRGCVPEATPLGLRPDGGPCFTAGAGGPRHLAALPRVAFLGPEVPLAGAGGEGALEAEGNVAVDPRRGGAVAVYLAVTGRGMSLRVARAGDDGRWEPGGAVALPAPAQVWDPVVDVAWDGVARLVFLSSPVAPDGVVAPAGVRLARSEDGGRTWSAPVDVAPEGHCAPCDKPWLASGPGPGTQGAVYVGYQGAGGALVVRRSDDGGRTWAAPSLVASREDGGGAPNLVQLAVAPDGALAVTWVVAAPDADGRSRYGSPSNRVMFRRSRDGAATWEPARVVSGEGEAPVFQQAPVAVRGDAVPVAYVAYVAGGAGAPGGAWDVRLATSADGGRTWRRRTANDDPERCATHALPALALDPASGDLHLLWHENRFGEGAVVYARCPGDAALACGRNGAVASAGFRFTTGRDLASWHGDYSGLAVDARGRLWATWSDTRTGRPAVWSAR